MSPEDPGPPGPRAGDGATGLLEPGAGRGYAVAGDAALLAALVRAEVAWAQVLADVGGAPQDLPRALSDGLAREPVELAPLVRRAEQGGNPVIPLVEDLRGRAGGHGRFVHRGLTSQDVLDTALMLVAGDVLDDVATSLVRLGDALAGHAERHAGTPMTGRTLGQHAVPITFGLKAAQWLAGVHEVLDDVLAVRATLPVQCGGAAGTLAGAGVAAATRAGASGTPYPPPAELAARWAEVLHLTWPGAPWHTRRRAVTRLGDALAAAVAAAGHVASDVTTLSRPEIGEVAEGGAAGHGRSSTMPHKRNPVLSVLVRSAGVQAGALAGVLQQCAALAVDERPDGSWHAEWPTLQRLAVLAVTATDQCARAVEGLVVDPGAMARRVDEEGDLLLSEWRGLARDLPEAPGPPDGARPEDYLGAAAELTATAVDRWRGRADR